MKGLRIGILGGSFDPIHKGHMSLARAACRRLRLDRLLLIPASIPPHKQGRRLAPASRRLAMVRLAASALRAEGFSVWADPLELSQPRRISYTIDTVLALRRRFGPNARFFLVLGSDSLDLLPAWRRVGDLLDRVTVAVASRPGFPVRRQIARTVKRLQALEVASGTSLKFAVIPMRPVAVSATVIRRLEQRPSALPTAVSRYAAAHRLYGFQRQNTKQPP